MTKIVCDVCLGYIDENEKKCAHYIDEFDVPRFMHLDCGVISINQAIGIEEEYLESKKPIDGGFENGEENEY